MLNNETIFYLSGKHQDKSIFPTIKKKAIRILEESVGEYFCYLWVCQNVQHKIIRVEESVGGRFQHLPLRSPRGKRQI